MSSFGGEDFLGLGDFLVGDFGFSGSASGFGGLFAFSWSFFVGELGFASSGLADVTLSSAFCCDGSSLLTRTSSSFLGDGNLSSIFFGD